MITPAAEIPAEVQAVKQRLGIVGSAPPLIAALQRAVKVAPIDLSVLVTGESGSGKEFFPRIIHQYSPRKHSKYIAVNCGAIPEGTIDSELFGHEKGSFTGAVSSRKGYFEEADGGTIFLDEVAELPLTTQARLLRVLETGEYLRVGSSSVMKTNIRVVAATNVDLLQAVEQGRFREDLYYRLSTVLITVPPLRDRGDDIIMLARKFASDFAEKQRCEPVDFDASAKALLRRYRWPGNVRQLKNVVDQISLFESGTVVTSDTVQRYIPANATVYSPVPASRTSLSPHTYESEREILFNMIFSLRHDIDELKARLDAADGTESPRRGHDTVSGLLPAVELLKAPVDDVTATEDTGGIVSQPPLERSERDTIIKALARNGGRRRETAAELRISERTLYRKLKELNIQ